MSETDTEYANIPLYVRPPDGYFVVTLVSDKMLYRAEV